MKSKEEIKQFNKSKIYEILDYQPEPLGYKFRVPWTVQQQIAATNGRHYIDRIGKLEDYPVYELPVDKVIGEKIMLDIGCGWGRWLVAGNNAGYTPVGLDLRLQFCKTSRRVLGDLKKQGYAIVADLENIPFKNNVFDLVWSFSVIQHTHIKRLRNCLFHINRTLVPDGFTYLEFPSKNGIRNRYGSLNESEVDDYNSWCVRYYSPDEYKLIFNEFLTEFNYKNHSFLGIGVLREDLRYVSLKNKVISFVSLMGSFLTEMIPWLANYSDSIYVRASKKKSIELTPASQSRLDFLTLHRKDPTDNLNVAQLLQCPLTGQSLILSKERDKLINQKEAFYYPIVDSIPIMIIDEKQGL